MAGLLVLAAFLLSICVNYCGSNIPIFPNSSYVSGVNHLCRRGFAVTSGWMDGSGRRPCPAVSFRYPSTSSIRCVHLQRRPWCHHHVGQAGRPTTFRP